MKSNTKKIIHSISAFTLLDYPDKTACILWFAGCNMKCSYCYNPEIVFGKGNYSIPEIISFLEKRRNLLDAVVFSGGECFLYKEVLELLAIVKQMGFLIKVDTNGSLPQRLQQAIDLEYIDYVAIDFKAPQSKTKNITKANFYDQFINCVSILQENKIPFEVRTTVHSELLNQTDLREMITVLENQQYSGNYYLQSFRNGVETIEKMNSSNYVGFTHLTSDTIWVQMR